MEGTLYVCATPIGNLEDITQRVLQTLRAVDLIAAEDTRHTKKLLNHYGIHTPLISYHQHNERERSQEILQMLRDGKQIALVSDAGTPAISDPGQILVRRCRDEGLAVTALPGPCALITALSMSGLDSRRFVFEGFLPAGKRERAAVLERLVEETRTVILYEAPHRLVETLQALHQAVGDRRAAAVRELTKRFEDIRMAPLGDLCAFYEETEPKGEFVLLLEGREEAQLTKERQAQWEAMSLTEHMAVYAHLPEKEAMKQVAKDRGVSKRDIYEQLKT